MERTEFAKLWKPALVRASQPAISGPFDVVVIEVVATGQGPGLGIKEGDMIRRYNGEEIVTFEQIVKMTGEIKAESIPLEIQRGDEVLKLTAKPGKLGLRLENRLKEETPKAGEPKLGP